MKINIEYVDKLHPVFTKPKRVKIIVGGRGSTKSTGVADYVASRMASGELWCCAREQLNSIEESVHRTLLDEIDRIKIPSFSDTKTGIQHISGGRCFYRGLSRNQSSLKSTLSGVDGLWIEEGEDLSSATLRVLTASVRLNAADTQKAIDGEEVKMPEIIITMNRGSRADPMSKKFLSRADKALEKCGYYEDDFMMVVELNYTDMPEEWFLLSGLEAERKDDEEQMSLEEYEHKWLGKYRDSVDGAIIKAEWFDAAIDAHKTLGFKPRGAIIAAHDPADSKDEKAIAIRKGSVFLDIQSTGTGDVNDACDWALDIAIKHNADLFTWDCDGLGLSLKRQVSDSLSGKRIDIEMFRGSGTPDFPKRIYDPIDNIGKPKTNRDAFKNKRSQYYWLLRDRFYKTYRAVVKGEYIDPEELISISSTIKDLPALRSEVCRIPLKPNPSGLIQIMSKDEMLSKHQIQSPNMADCLMMSMVIPEAKDDDFPELNYQKVSMA